MNEDAIRRRLVERGKESFKSSAKDNPLDLKKPPYLDETQYQEAKTLVHVHLTHHPHAFVIACIMDQQIDANEAWLLPYRLSQRIGAPEEPKFDFETLLGQSEGDIHDHMKGPPSLHHYHKRMSQYVHTALRHIADKYGGRAEKIWSRRPSSASLVYRFLEFKGAGPKVATMAANILVRHFKIPVSDYFSIDISPDRHVRRVFRRLEIIPSKQPSDEQIIYRARELHPEFPGLLDLPMFKIGRNWCTHNPQKRRCSECFMNDLCPNASSKSH